MLATGVFCKVKELSNREVWIPKTVNTLRSGIVRATLKGRMWEPHIARKLKQKCTPGSTAVDAGGLWGILTFVLSDAVGPMGHVHTFEPQPWCYDGIRRTIEHNSQPQFHDNQTINVHNVALSDNIGKMRFCADETGTSNVLSDSFPRCQMKRKSDRTLTNILTVDVKTLDSFRLTNVSCIKIDTEGHETSIIKGALNTIEENKPTIVVEIKRKNLEEFRGLMTNLGYRNKSLRGENYIFTHQSRNV